MSWLHEEADIVSEKYTDDSIEVVAKLSVEVAQKLDRDLPDGNLRRLDLH